MAPATAVENNKHLLMTPTDYEMFDHNISEEFDL